MPLISIEGCSGIGKSLLTRQLSALARWPAISEGEAGAIPEWVFQSFSRSEMTTERMAWFVERCRLGCQRARAIATDNRYCFIDSGPLTSEAYCRVDLPATDPMLTVYRQYLRRESPDLSVLLVTSPTVIQSRIDARQRPPEQNRQFIDRILSVQQQCLDLAQAYHTLIVQRDEMDFLKESDLRQVWQTIAASANAQAT